MRVFIDIIAFVLIIVITGTIAWIAHDPLTSAGVLGSCFEGGCAYAALFVGFPLITGVLSIIGCSVWVKRRQQ